MVSDSKLPDGEITELLLQWRSGSRDAFDRLIPLVYAELRHIASRRLAREWRDHPLQTTALVNEAYLKLLGQRADWRNRAHFFAIAAQLMRRIVIDEARRRLSLKRGRDIVSVALEEVPSEAPVHTVDVLALDGALRDLERLDPGQGRLVELRYFSGLTVEETAEVLGVSPATVKREWAVAKGWLHRALTTGTR